MNLDNIKDFLERVPFTALLVAYLGWLSYDYYSFKYTTESPLQQKKVVLENIQKGNLETRAKIKEADEFFRSLDVKKAELRALAQQLSEMKATLTEDLDTPSLIKGVITEARKVGLTVVSIRPTAAKNFEYYSEQAFDLSFRGIYVQLLVFLERLSSFERIVRVDNVEMKRTGSALASYVALEGTVQLKAYRYLGSKADDVANGKHEAPVAATPATANGAIVQKTRPGDGK